MVRLFISSMATAIAAVIMNRSDGIKNLQSYSDGVGAVVNREKIGPIASAIQAAAQTSCNITHQKAL